jgi:hypothetical protein
MTYDDRLVTVGVGLLLAASLLFLLARVDPRVPASLVGVATLGLSATMVRD